MNRITFLAALLLAATLGNARTPAREVSNDKYGFRFEVPDDFVQIEEEGEFILYQFGTHQPTPDKPATIVKLERLGGTIDPDESVDPKDWESAFNSKVNVVKAQWSGFTLDLIHTKLESAGTPLYLYLAQIPLEPEAIQLIAGGPDNATTRQLFLNTLKSKQVNRRPIAGVPMHGQSQATSDDLVALGDRVARYNKSTRRLHDFKHQCSVIAYLDSFTFHGPDNR